MKQLIEAPVNGGRNYRDRTETVELAGCLDSGLIWTVTVVTYINLAICWKLRESSGTRRANGSDNPRGADNQQERLLVKC